MSSEFYAIVFQGEISEGAELISVKAHMAKMLKADAKKMAVVFSGKPIVLKKTADKQEAIKIGTILKKIGAEVKVRVIKQDASKATAAKPAAQPSGATTGEGSFDLAPNKGNIFDPEPEKVAPVLDLSGFEVGENDGTLLIESEPFEKIELDLSEYDVAENDGSLLIEPAAEVPKIEAPDFGLDKPGAILETLQEEKVLVNPDISSIGLASQEGDILKDDEKDNTPPPKAPDTSQIKLVSDSD